MELEMVLSALTGLGARWVLWLLVALSVLGVGIIVERGLCFWFSRDDVRVLERKLVEMLEAGELAGAEKLAMESPSFEARVATAALRTADVTGADDRMQGETARVRVDMERNLAFLSTVGSNAPFLGLLGTVIGIIGAFKELDRSHGALTAGLMSEIGEALVATAVGLVVALPAIAAFNVFRRLIAARLSSIEAMRLAIIASMRAVQRREHV